jgi:hypothetical protein
MRPAVFLKSDSVLRRSAFLVRVRASRVPQPHRYCQSAKTSCAEYGVAYVVRFPVPTDPLRVRSRAVESSAQAWSRSSPVPLAYRRLLNHRISQVPGEPIPYLCPALGSRPVRRPSPCRRRRCSPHLACNEDTSNTEHLETQSRGFSTRCLRFKQCVTAPHARLASGWWLAVAGRESNPLDSIEKFPPSTSDFLLFQIYPGATAKFPHAN